MNKKKLGTALVSLALVGTIGVGATLAYLSDNTSTITNTFVIGNGIDITLTEQKYENGQIVNGQRWDADTTAQTNSYPEIVANSEFTKDPTTTVKKGSNDCWVFMHVTGVDQFELVDINKDGTTDLTIDNWSDEWTKISEESGKDGWYVYNNKVTEDMTKDQDLPLAALFGKVKVGNYDKVVTKEVPQIVIQSYAIQADGLTKEQAYAEVTQS